MMIWLGTQEGSLAPSPLSVNASTSAQPFALDATGNMRADLMGHLPLSKDKLSIWRNVLSRGNVSEAFVIEDAPLSSAEAASKVPTCHLADPHSSAFIDLNGDCLADLFLVCADSGWGWGSKLTYQIWIANKGPKSSGYTLARQGQLPPGTGALSFADMDRDGTIDVVFPSCDGKNGPCYINIAYNRQMPLCSEKRDDWFGVGPGGAALPNDTRKCRDTESNLCTADDSFSFDFSVSSNNDKLTRIPVADITPESQLLMSDDLLSPAVPIPLSLGDFNRDGYPDLAVITVPKNARSGETRLRLLESVSCAGKGQPQHGCPIEPAQRRRHRTFAMLAKDVEAIEIMLDVRSATFFDLDEDGSLDLLVQRLPSDRRSGNQRRITFIQNNFFYDAFFLKAMTSNGACFSYCDPSGPGKQRYRPWGVNYGGASYKFTVLDTNGIRRPQQVGQLAQTAYRSLLLPYAYFGLGRTNNYVESLFVGVTRKRTDNFVEMEGVIPNSQVVILPWEPSTADDTLEEGDTSTWQRELYLSPGEWIPWVTVVLATIVVMLLGIVFVLHLNEKVGVCDIAGSVLNWRPDTLNPLFSAKMSGSANELFMRSTLMPCSRRSAICTFIQRTLGVHANDAAAEWQGQEAQRSSLSFSFIDHLRVGERQPIVKVSWIAATPGEGPKADEGRGGRDKQKGFKDHMLREERRTKQMTQRRRSDRGNVLR